MAAAVVNVVRLARFPADFNPAVFATQTQILLNTRQNTVAIPLRTLLFRSFLGWKYEVLLIRFRLCPSAPSEMIALTALKGRWFVGMKMALILE